MPRKAIDYSNTIIYKLCCNNPNITDVYVGHTTDFTNRKRNHKQSCNNENNKSYNFYVYQFIRENGGWTNWSMIEIEKICCIGSNEACKHERIHLELLKATLNINIPSRTRKETTKIYNDNNKEKLKEKHKIYNDNNVEKIKETNKIYREENVEKEQIRHKIYREENVEKLKEKNKIYREENVEKLKEINKIYRDNNKEKIKEKKHELQKHIKLETDKLFDIDV